MKVLISDPITESGLKILKESNLEIVHLPDASIEEKSSASKDVHGWIIRSGTAITDQMIKSSKNLQVIGRAGVGVDNIDISAATRKGIVVMNTPDVNTISVAEHTLAMILSLSRNTLGVMEGKVFGSFFVNFSIKINFSLFKGNSIFFSKKIFFKEIL